MPRAGCFPVHEGDNPGLFVPHARGAGVARSLPVRHNLAGRVAQVHDLRLRECALGRTRHFAPALLVYLEPGRLFFGKGCLLDRAGLTLQSPSLGGILENRDCGPARSGRR